MKTLPSVEANRSSRPIGVLAVTCLFIWVCGCFPSTGDPQEEFLIRVGDHQASVADFNRAFEIAKSAYPHNLMQQTAAYREAQVRLLNQITEELILRERAAELNISVSEQEVETAVEAIKKDYPQGEFEQTLLEYAISYKAWRDGVRTRLLMEKIIDRELKDQITITPEDIANYYDENFKGEQFKPGGVHTNSEVNQNIIEHLKRKKAETAYRDWIDKIRQRYTIQINEAQWEKILSS